MVTYTSARAFPSLLLLLLTVWSWALTPSLQTPTFTPPPHTTTTNTTTTPTTTTTTTVPSRPGVPPSPTVPESRRHRRGRRRCRCMKRLKKELNQLIEHRLHDFETRYLLSSLAGDNAPNTVNGRLQTVEGRLQKVRGEVSQTKEALSLMQSQLRQLRQEMSGAADDLAALNATWRTLDGAVETVSRFVSAVDDVLPPPRPACPSADCQPAEQPMEDSFPRNCDEVYRQGGMQFKGDYYIMIKPDGVTHPFKVMCKALNKAGWTVIQRRVDGSVDFFRDWGHYKAGFGSPQGEFWLGNDNIHHLTAQEPTMLRIDMEDHEGRHYHATYDSFRIDNEQGLYRLHVAGYHGNAGDSLKSRWENHDGMPFSTKDRDNDGRYYDNCAQHFHGAWWFNNCFDSHLNGRYYQRGSHQNYFQRDGVQWNSIHMYSSLRSVHMMLRPAPPQLTLSALDLRLENKVKVKDVAGGEEGGRQREEGEKN